MQGAIVSLNQAVICPDQASGKRRGPASNHPSHGAIGQWGCTTPLTMAQSSEHRCDLPKKMILARPLSP
jgi:hypothetical protein